MRYDEKNPHLYLYGIFVRQDYENDNFDVTFHVNGKELFAHRDVLAFASPVFKELFKKNRPTRDDPINRPIQIDGYSYDEFYEFLRLIYCDDDYDDRYPEEDMYCTTIELVKLYGCDELIEYISEHMALYGALESFHYDNEIINDKIIEDIFKELEFAHKYSTAIYKKSLNEILDKKILVFAGYNGFINLDKSAIKAFLHHLSSYIPQKEELCKAIYKWGEYQAMITVEMPEEEKNQLILHQIKDVLPFIYHKNLVDFFVKKKGLISVDEANKLKTIKVSVTSNDKTITGTFVDSFGIYGFIESRKNRTFYHDFTSYFEYYFLKHLSIVEKVKDVNWYFVFEKNKELYVKHQSKIKTNDYLIAKMKASNENEFGENDGESMIKEFEIAHFTVSRQF